MNGNDGGDLEVMFQEALRLHREGKAGEAEPIYRHILSAAPGNPEVHYLLGKALENQNRPEEALKSYHQALSFKPDLAEAYNGMGNIFHRRGAWDTAITCFQAAIKASPGFVGAYVNLGNTLKRKGDPEAAVKWYRKALTIAPDDAAAHNNLGNIFLQKEDLEQAAAHYGAALRREPGYADALNNRGTVYKKEGRFAEALTFYDKALAAAPGFAGAHMNRANILLLRESFHDGWLEYEWRLHIGGESPHFARFLDHVTAKQWDGSPPGETDRRLLVFTEQGLGDTIQFARFLPLLKSRHGWERVVVLCQKALIELLQGFPGVDEVLPFPEDGNYEGSFDKCIPLLSLPAVLGVSDAAALSGTAETGVPYLHVSPESAAQWELDEGVFRIGVTWAGNPHHPNDHNRSCRLVDFAPLARVPNVVFYSMQKGEPSAQAAHPPPGMVLKDVGNRLNRFSDTAALMANLDLVISVDTAPVHLAGALGVPVWTLLPFDPDWRWLLDRSDSPWYPTMKLFRQPKPKDWPSVFAAVKQDLHAAHAPSR